MKFFVHEGAIKDVEEAIRFWRLSGCQEWPVPEEIADVFVASSPTPEQNKLPVHAFLPTHDHFPVMPPPAFSLMPYRRNPLFVGRKAVLRDIADTLNQLNSVVAITAIAGMGKTQVAVEFVHRYGHYFTGGVFWLNFADGGLVPQEIAACGQAEFLNLAPNFAMMPIDRQVQLVRNAWQQPQPRLLIFDNCEDESLLVQWLPHIGGCRVLVTSRRIIWDPSHVDQVIMLPELQRHESVMLLEKYCPQIRDTSQFEDIAATLQDLPLALRLAGKYLAQHTPTLSVEHYLADLRATRLTDFLDHPSLQSAGISPTGHHQHLARAFALSYQRLRASNPIDQLATALMCRAAYFAPGVPITATLLCEGIHVEQSDKNDALKRLIVDLGLLEWSDDAVRIHRLVAAYTRATQNDMDTEKAVHQLLASYGMQAIENGEILPASLFVHLQYAANDAHDDELAAQLHESAGWQHYLLRNRSEAHAHLQRAYSLRAALGDRLATASILEMLALLYQMGDRITETYSLMEQALQERLKVLPEHDPAVATSYNNIGVFMLFILADYPKARDYCAKSLRLRHQAHGLYHADVARSLRNLGYAYFHLGNDRAANRYLRLGLHVFEHISDGFHIARAQTWRHFGELAFRQGQYDEAWSCHMRSLALRKDVLPDEHSEIAESYYFLGQICCATNDLLEAERFLTKALAINEVLFAPHHDEILQIRDELGRLRIAQGQLEEARSQIEMAYTGYAKTLGETNPHTLRSVVSLGLLARASLRYQEAKHYFQEAYNGYVTQLSSSHPLALTTLRLLNERERTVK